MKRKITVELVIREPRHCNAQSVVDEVLESGVFQDAINEYETDEGTVEVLSALIRTVE